MTKIKLCGLRRAEDIEAANLLKPDYIGFVFYKKSKRYISFEQARILKSMLKVKAVGVFVDENPKLVADFLEKGIIDLAQLHGSEDEAYIKTLRKLTDKPLIKAFQIKTAEDLKKAEASSADMILLDAGTGDGVSFDWDMLKSFNRPYFLAGGMSPENVRPAIEKLHPYGVDVSSGIETDGVKDIEKMREFMTNARSAG
ncbi:MAG: phosphoribosylanthranilate isomerase [Lachnospiraceae bacterium]|nr:phosphoribosylanthranilate isomerase [Lachnospiraceae bacterium]